MKKRLLAIVIPVLVIAAGWYGLVERPQAQERDESAAKALAATNQRNALRQQVLAGQSATIDPAEITKEADAVAKAVPSELALGDFILRSEAAAKETGVVVLSLDAVAVTSGASPTPTTAPSPAKQATTTAAKAPTTTAKAPVATVSVPSPLAAPVAAGTAAGAVAGGVVTTPLQITARGEPARLVAYVGKLQAMERIVRIDSTNLTSDDRNNGQIVLSIKLFHRPQ